MKYFCDYCDAYLTHDSPSVRKTHCSGRKHKENVHIFYKNWMEEQAQSLIDATTAAFKAGKIPKGAAIPPPPGMVSGPTVPGAPIGHNMPSQGPMSNMGPPRISGNMQGNMGMPPMGPRGPMMGDHSFMGPSGLGMPPVMMTGMPNGPGAPWRPQHMPPQGPMGNMGPPPGMGGNMQGNMGPPGMGGNILGNIGPPGMGGNMQGNMGMPPMMQRGPMMGGLPMMGPSGPGMPPGMITELHQS